MVRNDGATLVDDARNDDNHQHHADDIGHYCRCGVWRVVSSGVGEAEGVGVIDEEHLCGAMKRLMALWWRTHSFVFFV